MKSNFGDKVRIQHIKNAIKEIESYTHNISFEDFSSKSIIIYASIKQLEIIGEAANHISDELKSTYSEANWKDIIGLRNMLVHEYFGIDEEIIWTIIIKDLPIFKEVILKILSEI